MHGRSTTAGHHLARILVADDEAEIRVALRLVLEAAGHDVLEASDGAVALKAFAATPTDLVLCDLFMPTKDGLETIVELVRRFPDAKIIAMSGGGATGLVGLLPAARRLGAAAVIHKPFRAAELLEVIRGVLETR